VKVFRKLDDVPADLGPTVVSIGNFDGVHCGHQKVLGSNVARARELDATSMVITFNPHPARILRPDAPKPLLTPLPEKLRLFEKLGIATVLVLPFTRDLSIMAPRDFAREVLRERLHALEIHEGENFHFGRQAEGNVYKLEEFGRKLGFKVHVYGQMTLRGEPVSSSRIRELILEGKVRQARALLGRPFSILSSPERGRGYGHRYTVPTINLSRYDEILPKNGVYITWTRVAEDCFESVTNLGMRPTFGLDTFAIETHLLNFHPIDLLPDTEVEICFVERLRDEMKFPSTEALRVQIGHDVHRTQRYFRLLGKIRGTSG
jgi:riboflavin kinase / FMN adenylyltransferase